MDGVPDVIEHPLKLRGDENRTILFQPDPDLPAQRIKEQEGWLLLFPDRKSGSDGPQTSLEGNKRYAGKINCLRIDPVVRELMQRELLREHGISQEVLFPHADGLGLGLGLRMRYRLWSER